MEDISQAAADPGSLRISGEPTVTVQWPEIPRRWSGSLSRRRLGFECASGDWIERTWVGIPMFDLLADAPLSPSTTHLRLESDDCVAACIPITALEEAMIALGDSEGESREATPFDDVNLGGEYPRFVSPAVLGPRTVKRVSLVEPLALDPGTDRTEYESLPEQD